MANRPGEASQRPSAGSTFTVSTQAMEDAARNLRASAVLVTMSEARQDINPQLVAKALERKLNIPWDQMHVSKHHPEDFLVRFGHARHRDTAVEAGAVPCRGVALTLPPWTSAARGHQRVSRFYCRLAIEGLPVQAWRREAVQDAIGLSCKVDRLERQSSSLSNSSLAYAWVWAWSPDDIPAANGFSIIDRPAADVRGLPALPEGRPREEGVQGPQFPILIHLDQTQDYSPVCERPPGASTEWPLIDRFCWERFIEDGQAGTGRRRAAPACAVDRHRRRDDDDEHHDNRGRRRARSRSSRRGGLLGYRSDRTEGSALRRQANGPAGRHGRLRRASPRDGLSPRSRSPSPVSVDSTRRSRSRSRERFGGLSRHSRSRSPRSCPSLESVAVLGLHLPLLQGMPAPEGTPIEGALHGQPLLAEPDMHSFQVKVEAAWNEITHADPLLLEIDALSS